MNCAQHPQAPATGYCQNCGKALCPLCTRGAGGLILCEPCLHARYPQAAAAFSGAAPNPGYSGVPFTPVGGPYTPVGATNGPPPYAAPGPRGRPNPALAGWLGVIPGVGAMYNGQFVKALLHVLIFVGLIGLTQHFDLMGIVIAAWVIYQIFDAAQTAAARRDGLPLPDPFGLLDLSRRMGPQTAPYVGPQAAYIPLVAAAYAAPPVAPAAALTPVPSTPVRRGEPIGALVLIVVGTLLLLSTLGVFDVDWVGRGWPVLLIVLGGWLLQRRVREGQAVSAPAQTPFTPVPPDERRNPFSITPEPNVPREPGGAREPNVFREEDPR